MTRRLFLLVTLSWLALAAAASQTVELEAQRALFRAAWPEAEKGRWILSTEQDEALASYPLYPDLRGTWMSANVAVLDAAQLARFVGEYAELNVTRRLLQKRARFLAASGQWNELTQLVDEFENFDLIANNSALHCQILRMRIETSNAKRDELIDEALGLWLIGHSQASECDPLFEWLAAQGELGEAIRSQRVDLAINARQFQLATWLAKSLGSEEQLRVNAWRRMARNPGQEIAGLIGTSSLVEPALLAYGMSLAGRANLDQALATWDAGARLLANDQTAAAIERDLALRAVYDHRSDATDMLAALSPAAADDLTTAWRLRLALKSLDWTAFEAAYPLLSREEQARELWQFWRARSELESGNSEVAATALDLLADERSYYGFLAADLLGRPYQFANQPIVAEEALILRIEQDRRMIRARELFEVGQYSAARSEWNDFVAGHDERVLAQASVLAHRWGWHSSAISAAAQSGLYNALEIRFPQPWAEEFALHARQAGIPLSWAYGIARSESLYMSDVRSPAGAIGLMQLMPATGQEVGQRLGRQVNGWRSLVDPDTNIALGTGYLGEMLARFGDNPVLATAAYNAGPQRVAKWLPENETLDAEIWVDTIPFRETRRYLRRVLSSQVIFSWQMQEDSSLSMMMPPVAPPQIDERVAQQNP